MVIFVQKVSPIMTNMEKFEDLEIQFQVVFLICQCMYTYIKNVKLIFKIFLKCPILLAFFIAKLRKGVKKCLLHPPTFKDIDQKVLFSYIDSQSPWICKH